MVEEDPETKLPEGVSQLLKFPREKSGILEVEDAGKYMRMFMKESHRKPRMSMRDYLAQFEVEEDRMQKAIKQIDKDFDGKKTDISRAAPSMASSRKCRSRRSRTFTSFGFGAE